MTSLADLIAQGPYQAYSYSYPHKSAYRPLAEPRSLQALWATQDRRALFAYVHVPFCTMRCGFCNLFAMAQPDDALVEGYVDAVIRQMHAMDDVLGERTFARFALGGGTPTYLEPGQLERLYVAARDVLGVDLQATPSSIEASPETVTRERLAACRAAGVTRVSMGVQSFSARETTALARHQQGGVVIDAIGEIRRAGFPVMNLDLIYGIEGQTIASLLASVDSAIALQPEELYLYPLYVREQTGLGKIAIRHAPTGADTRQSLYLAARDRLLDAGWEQVSMRMFRAPHAPADTGPVYCCQEDGMVGLGAGARSYASTLHYSTGYAVARAPTRELVADFNAHDAARFRHAAHGFELDDDERRRRYVIQSLLTRPGFDREAYARRFGSRAEDDLPQLRELRPLGLAEEDGVLLRLTPQGVAFSDVIGPWLVSSAVHERMQRAPC